ncbi:MAG TPA: diacylglycerol kinase family protein [Opitutaceae bacterium]|nr:diacylglycerol kinase family protein [Opitutaceae bacterium]
MKVRFIINPCSGHNRRRPWLPQAIRDYATTRLRESDVAVTEGPGHATELARSAIARGHELVVAVGGDGTMNEVAQAVTNTPAALALVPCGSGNGLALHLGLPRSLRSALELISGDGHRIAAIDTGFVNDQPFFNAMGLGLDAEVSRRFNGLTKRGLPAYVRAAAAVLWRMPRERCTITAGETRLTLDTLLVAVANSDQYGNNARIAPGAHVDDGLLDLVAVEAAGPLRLVALGPRLFLGNIDRCRDVHRLRAASFTILRTGPGIVHTDGETLSAGAEITVRVNPRSLRVLVPAASRLATAPATIRPSGFVLQLP